MLIKCWMVWVPGRAMPTRVHYMHRDAEDEATRICRKEGVPVLLMEAITGCEPGVRPVTWRRTDPFVGYDSVGVV